MNIFSRIAGVFSRSTPADQEDLDAAREGRHIRDDMTTLRVGQKWLNGQNTQPDHDGRATFSARD
jgi:hypothetical protein